MKAERRRGKIVELLEHRGSVRVEELAGAFGVSQVTIRKDLRELELRGLLRRTHGGAAPAHKSLFNPSFREKAHLQQAQKRAVARAALEHVEEGDTLILDAGTTALALAALMKKALRSAYVITNSLPVALELADTGWEILLVGGHLRQHSMALIGPAAADTLARYHADKAFLSATGVSLERGYTTPNPLEADTKRAMIRAARAVYALADGSKLGQTTLASFALLEEIDLLLTDESAPAGFLRGLEARGLKYQLGRP